MTPAMRRLLGFIAANEPVALFPIDMSRKVRVRAIDDGLIECCGTERGHGGLGLTQYRLTQAGSEAME